MKRSLANVDQPAGIPILDSPNYLATAWSVVTAATVKDGLTKCFGGTDCTAETVGDLVDCDELDTVL